MEMFVSITSPTPPPQFVFIWQGINWGGILFDYYTYEIVLTDKIFRIENGIFNNLILKYFFDLVRKVSKDIISV